MNSSFLQEKKLRDYLGYFFVLTFFIILAYANSLNNVFLSDDYGIIQNKNLGTLKDIFSQPLSPIRPFFYLIAYKIGGLNPIAFRLINIFLHLGSVWLVFIIISILTNRKLALIASLIFSVHPILVEAVTWISGGGYVQYSFFFLLSFLAYILSGNNRRYYFLSIVAFLCSLLSSVTATSLSLLFFCYEMSFGSLRKNWLKSIVFVILSTIFLIIVLSGGFSQRLDSLQRYNYQEKKVLINPFVQVPIAITSYLQLIFWPDKLTLYHSEMSFGKVEYLIRLISLIGLIGLIGYSWRKNKLIFFWLMFFIISLLPTLTPFGVSWIVAERYVYLGSLGVIGVVGYGLWKLIQNKKTEAMGYLIVIIIIISFIIRTIIRNNDWKNEDNLWIATGKTSPSYHVTHNNLGDVYGRRGNFKQAVEEFKLAIKIKPNYADAYHNLGNTYRQIGKINEAMESYKKAFQLNPYLWQSPMNIAAIYFEQEKYNEAIDFMQKSIKVNPNNSLLYANVGVIYLKTGDKKKAEEFFINALRIDPNNQQARAGLLEVNK